MMVSPFSYSRRALLIERRIIICDALSLDVTVAIIIIIETFRLQRYKFFFPERKYPTIISFLDQIAV